MARRLWISVSSDHVRGQLWLERQVGVATTILDRR